MSSSSDSQNSCTFCKKEDFLSKCLKCRKTYYKSLTSDDAEILISNWLQNYFQSKKAVLELNYNEYGRFILFIELDSFEKLKSDDLEWTLLPYFSIKDIPDIGNYKKELEQYEVTIMIMVKYNNRKYMKTMSASLH